MKRIKRIICLFLVLSMVLTGCSSGAKTDASSNSETSKGDVKKDTLVYGVSGEPHLLIHI